MSFLQSVPFISSDPGSQVRQLAGYSAEVGGGKTATGVLSALFNNKNTISHMQYPSDLGTGPFMSWITFNILKSSGTATTPGGFGGIANLNGVGDKLGTFVTGQIKTGLSAGVGLANDALSKLGSAGQIGTTNFGNFLPTARRVTQTNKVIAFYMPNQLVFSQTNAYNEASLTDQLGTAGLAGSAIENSAGAANGGKGRPDAALSEFATPLIPLTSLQASTGVYMTTGLAINPMIEVIFQQTPMRNFQFEFMLMARSASEGAAIKNIIQEFRQAAKPDVAGSDGRYLVPPDEFDIKFYFNGAENENIPKISTCVITDVTVDFAPSGQYNTFYDGKPTAIRFALTFKEVEMITKQRVNY